MARHRWEYHTSIVLLPLQTKDLAKAGQDGWELLNVIPLSGREVQLVFKRPESPLQDRITDEQRASALDESS